MKNLSYIFVGLTLTACLCAFCIEEKHIDSSKNTNSSGVINFISDDSFTLITERQKQTQTETIDHFSANGNNEASVEALKTDDLIKPQSQQKKEDRIFRLVEKMPSFPGGVKALMEYLENNVNYPEEARQRGVQGRVTVTFVVEKDGSITNISISRSADPALDKEAIRLIKSMPKWNPGMHDGQNVRVEYNVPVVFRL